MHCTVSITMYRVSECFFFSYFNVTFWKIDRNLNNNLLSLLLNDAFSNILRDLFECKAIELLTLFILKKQKKTFPSLTLSCNVIYRIDKTQTIFRKIMNFYRDLQKMFCQFHSKNRLIFNLCILTSESSTYLLT